MRRHPKAPAVGSTLGTGSSRVRFGGAFATRGASRASKGSGAPSTERNAVTVRRHLKASSAGSISGRGSFALALVVAAFVALALAPVSQAKILVGGFGTNGTLGGQFTIDASNNPAPRGIAVNNSGNGAAKGITYVVDSAGNRIERFSPTGSFERTWGQNVLGRDEKQTVTLSGVSGGSFTLSYNGNSTAAINVTVDGSGTITAPSATEIRDALLAAPVGIGSGNVVVSGSAGSYTVRFIGTLDGTDVSQLTASGAGLAGSAPSVAVATAENGSGGNSSGFEICTVAANCQDGMPIPGTSTAATTANGGDLNNPQGVAVNQANGHVYVTDQGNRRVQEFDADGNFVRAWGWNVDSSNPSTGFEICTVAANCTTAAAAGTGVGQFGSMLGYPITDPSNNVWVPDPVNARIQVFNSSGAFLKIVGGDVITNGAQGAGTLTANSKTISSVTTTSKFFEVGQTITSPDHPGEIPPGTTIESCSPSCAALAPITITLSQNAAASVTAGPQTLSVAAGAGNVPSDETQTVLASKSGGGIGAFNPTFNGTGSNSTTASTAATATGNFTSGSAVVTNVNFTGGTLFVGEIVTKNGTALPTETTITAIDTVAKTITLSKAFTGSNETAKMLTGFAILVNDSASAVQTKLELVPTIGAGNVSVSGPAGGPWAVKFVGRFAGTDVPQMTNLGAGRSPSSVTVSISSANPGALESCAVAAECRTSAAASGTALGQFGVGQITLPTGGAAAGFGDLAFDSSGNLYVIDTFNARVQKLNSTFTTATQFGAATFPAYTSLVPEHLAATQSGGRLAFIVVEAGANAFTGERKIVELDPNDGSVKDTSLEGAGLTPNSSELGTIQGLANNNTTGNLYATVGSAASPRRVLALNATANEAPFVAINDVTTKGSTTATFSGNVDPKGGLVSCSFQYSTDQVTWTDVKAPGCDSLDSGGGSQPVSVNATGLGPATHYFVRLAVSRPLVANSTVTSGSKAFDTDGVPPVVSNVGAVDIQDTSARFVGTIDPRNSATGYVFEYGTTPALGSTTSGVNIGSGTSPVIISQEVDGLSPDTTYYFRLSATNLTGTTSSGSKTLKTRSEPLPLPEHRAYEQVTPDALNNVDAGIFEEAMATVARDGNTVGVCNFYPPEGEGSGFCGSIYNSRRTATGWQSKSFLPPTCAKDPLTGAGGTNGALGGISLWSKNLDLAVFVRSEFAACPFSPLTLNPDAQTDVVNAYRGDFVSGSYDLLAPNPSLQTIELASHQKLGASDDFGVIFYQSQTQQTVVGQAAPAGSFSKLYEWDHGTLRLASVKPQAQGGTPFTESVEIAYAGLGGVSDTGSRVFFQSPPAPSTSTQLYMREGGTTTYDIGQSECTTSCGSASWKAFAGASEDGSMALFETPQKLSNEDNDPSTTVRDLYLYRQTPNPASERNLYVLTRDEEPADGTSAQLRGELGRSADGKVVFFAAAGQIVPGATTAPGFKIYRWRWNGGSPKVDFLANLDGTPPPGNGCAGTYKNGLPWTDEQNWTCEQRNLGERFLPEQERVSRVRADGGQLTIDTIKALDPVADTDATRDVYTWDEAHGWRCVSCQAPGVPSAGESQAQGPNGLNGREMVTQNDLPALITSSDGKKIFFTSRDELVPQDTNGTVRDVYEWNDGTVSLISSGTSSADNLLVGTTPSGNDVFFITSQRLVGWDTDGARDIYDARVGGGFPEPPSLGDICEGEACRSAVTSAPANTGAGTAVFQGPGNSGGETKKPCPKGTRKVKQVCKKRRHHSKAKKHRRAASNDRRASR